MPPPTHSIPTSPRRLPVVLVDLTINKAMPQTNIDRAMSSGLENSFSLKLGDFQGLCCLRGCLFSPCISDRCYKYIYIYIYHYISQLITSPCSTDMCLCTHVYVYLTCTMRKYGDGGDVNLWNPILEAATSRHSLLSRVHLYGQVRVWGLQLWLIYVFTCLYICATINLCNDV